MKSFAQQSTFTQLAAVLGLIMAIAVPCWAGFLWAADKQIDDKFATDHDLKQLQKTVASQVDTLKTSVDKNTKFVQQTMSSVDSLTLVVLDLQIAKLDEEIQGLERVKRHSGEKWNLREERYLREHTKTLKDLTTQRDVLFRRLRRLPI